jgi:hypothetical protein
MFKASILSAFLTALIVFSTSALAQSVHLVPPSPGTIEDPNIPIKLVADGPPRPLIRMDVPDKPKTLADASTGAVLSAR